MLDGSLVSGAHSASPGALPAAIGRADERIAEGLRAGGVPFRFPKGQVYWPIGYILGRHFGIDS